MNALILHGCKWKQFYFTLLFNMDIFGDHLDWPLSINFLRMYKCEYWLK